MVRNAIADSLRADVARALQSGGAQRLGEEVAFVLRALKRCRALTPGERIETMLADLRAGVSPYQAVGCYELVVGHQDSTIEVSREVMPPGGNTRQVLQDIERLARRLDESTVVDFGCGTGVLGFAALRACARTRGVLIDIDPHACELARRNATRLRLAHRTRILCGDTLEVIEDWAQVRLVVANLPFVRTSEVRNLPARFAVHSPRLAVDGGVDGLSLISPAIATLERRARPGTAVLLQVAPGRVREVQRLFSARWQPLPRTSQTDGEKSDDDLGCTVGVQLVSG